MVVYTSDGYHRLLVLKVPPRKFSSPVARHRHASRQMTFHDTADGLYSPGVRYTAAFYDRFQPGEEALQQSCREGHRMNFVAKPARFKRDNHPTCYEHADRSEADLLRSAERGVLEGPLHYEPWCVTQIGSLYCPVKDKFRNIWNARTSRVNESMAPAPAEYDYLQPVLSLQRPRCLQGGWDLKDAFWNNPRWQPHCDYMGVQLPLSKDFYRARFDMFGFSDAPKHQAEMAQVFKRVLNGTVHADGRSECTGIFVDDGHSVYDRQLGKVESDRRAFVEIDQLAALGVQASAQKTFLPASVKEYVGREIHSESQTVTLSKARAEKYGAAVGDLLQKYPPGVQVPRRELAGVIGKLQFVAPLIVGGQNMLSPLYEARDAFVNPLVASAPAKMRWDDGVFVHLDDRARGELSRFVGHMEDRPSRRYYLYEGKPEVSGMWLGQHSGDREYLTGHWQTPEGILAPTMDASGWQGGIALRDWRHILSFPPDQCAPHKSSNFREASTAASAAELLGPAHRGECLLFRSDNSTTVSLINKQGTMAPALWEVGERIFSAARMYDLDLACEQIPGVENGLSDGLSRYVRRKDYSDWQYRRDEFLSVQSELVRPFTLDGGADPVGTNAHLPRYCSEVDSFLVRSLAGEAVYANPDYALIREYLLHFLQCQRDSPYDTSGTFVVPVWDTYDWWYLVKGGRVLRYYPPDTELFTTPSWEQLANADGTYGFGSGRTFRGPTRWPVVVIHFPPLLPARGSSRSAAGAVVPGDGGPWRGVPVLSGDAQRDRVLLSQMHPSVVRGTTVIQRRGVRDFRDFLVHVAGHDLPASVQDVMGYIAYAVEVRPFRLDSSTVRSYLTGVTVWHYEMRDTLGEAPILEEDGSPFVLRIPTKHPSVRALLTVLDKHYKRPSKAKRAWTPAEWRRIFHFGFVLSGRSGRFQQLVYMMKTFGCLRPGAVRWLRVYFDLYWEGPSLCIHWRKPPVPTDPHVLVVHNDEELSPYIRGSLVFDKNADARKPKEFFIPSEVPALGVFPVQMLEEYVVREGLTSGSLLCRAPKGASGWYPGPYSGFGRAYQKAFARAFPGRDDACHYGGGSLRKSLDDAPEDSALNLQILTLMEETLNVEAGSLVGIEMDGYYVYDKYRLARVTDLPDEATTDSDYVLSDYSEDWRDTLDDDDEDDCEW
ncbi:hypothetical protein CYMTET_10781 [Cymbomonas tetramitiformis]|uniref:Uncharacterized protein n=1 Tax=Cymbomonas tetramitiformis TaxID=36881 RepID=A0AAE0LDH5_9CHLO|nr:hypothetical protein CYMTET_10781 [Cymbomonas tetramitiformis]